MSQKLLDGNYVEMPAPSTSSERPVPVPPDGELLAAYSRGGQEEAFTALVGRHFGLVMGAARRRTGDPHLAEEVAQITFGILARKAASLGRVESLAAWLHRVAVLQSIRALRQLARHRRKLELAMHHAQLHHDSPNPYEEALPWLDEALEELPDADRQLLVLRYYEGLSFADVSRRVGRSEPALRQQASRAVERLSKRLRRRGIAVPVAAIAASLGGSLAGPSASASSALLLARAALAAAPGVTGATLWLTTLLTMSTTKSIALTAAAALVLVSIPLGWQQIEINRLGPVIRVADGPVSDANAGRAPQPNGPARPSPRTVGSPSSKSQTPPSAPPDADPEADEEKMSGPMEAMIRGFFRRKAEAEADRAALSLGLLPAQAARYRDFLEKRYHERADAESEEQRAAFRREDRGHRENFIASLIGAEGLERFRAVEQRRDEVALEKASGDALHAIAHTVDLTEEQKQVLFQTFAAAARDDAAAGRPSSFSLSFGYGMDARPGLVEDDSVLSSILTPEQLALWQRHGNPDPDFARKAVTLIAPMVAGKPDLWKQMGTPAEPAPPSSPSNQ